MAPPEEDVKVVTVTDYVKAVCGAYKLPADSAWSQTVADLQVMLEGIAELNQDEEAAGSRYAKSVELKGGRERMTLTDHIELAQWQGELM